MEHVQKKAKITGHFRVALRPQDFNVQPSLKKLKKHHDHGKENIEIITINDEDDEDDDENRNANANLNLNANADENANANANLERRRLKDKLIIETISQQRKQLLVLHQQNNIIRQEQPARVENNKRKQQEDDEQNVDERQLNSFQEILRQQSQPIFKQPSTNKVDTTFEELELSNNDNDDVVDIEDHISKELGLKQVQEEEEEEEEECESESELDRKVESPLNKYVAPPGINPNIIDHDEGMLNDIRCEPHYAWDSFNYDRQQEVKFRNRKYLEDKQHEHQITASIRARLVDWLVQIQDMFELDHESLYMAVKIADQYLMRKTVLKQNLQLLYMTSILISAKFDERLPSFAISDLLEISHGKYSRRQIICLEIDILCTLEFNIRFPLSYGFLRRFAHCTNSDWKTLNLARYILESSLLDYEMIEIVESEIAAASLLLAFEMLHHEGAWNETAEFYTGYKQEDLYPILTKLNDMISRPAQKKISAIRIKYSHEVFKSVARIAPLPKM